MEPGEPGADAAASEHGSGPGQDPPHQGGIGSEGMGSQGAQQSGAGATAGTGAASGARAGSSGASSPSTPARGGQPSPAPRPRSWGELSKVYLESVSQSVTSVVQNIKQVGNHVIYSLAELDPLSETNLPPQVHMMGITYEVAPAGSLHKSSMGASALGTSVASSHSAMAASVASPAMLCLGTRLFRQDMQSLLWFTYRQGMAPINDRGLTSDAGWGCMLRSAQMLFAQALMVHSLGREWRLPDLEYAQMPTPYRAILEMFADHPSAPMSLHKIAAAGEEVGKKAGTWLGPNTVCSAIQRLHSRGAFGQGCNLQMLLFDTSDGDNTIYRSECKAKLQAGPLLILLPVRLGTYTIDRSYVPKVAAIFQLTQSLGFIGGRPNSAHYFVASRGNLVYFLDPHTTQPYVPLPTDGAEPAPDRHHSWHCHVQRRMNLKDIDASLTFGFYCNDEEDLDSLCEGIVAINAAQGGYAAVSVAESRTHYDSQNGWDQDDDDDGFDEEEDEEEDKEGEAPLAASPRPGPAD